MATATVRRATKTNNHLTPEPYRSNTEAHAARVIDEALGPELRSPRSSPFYGVYWPLLLDQLSERFNWGTDVDLVPGPCDLVGVRIGAGAPVVPRPVRPAGIPPIAHARAAIWGERPLRMAPSRKANMM
jgi:hypothetical protein